MNPVAWLPALGAVFLALILTILPLPESISPARPAFVPLVLVYLCLSTPSRFGIIWAFALGLILDVIHASAPGQHALALSLLSYLALKIRDSLQVVPAWQQMLALAPCWLAYQGLLLWLDDFVGQAIDPSWRWIPVISTSLAWPILVGIFALIDHRPHHND